MVFLSQTVCRQNCLPVLAIFFESGEVVRLQTGLPGAIGGRSSVFRGDRHAPPSLHPVRLFAHRAAALSSGG